MRIAKSFLNDDLMKKRPFYRAVEIAKRICDGRRCFRERHPPPSDPLIAVIAYRAHRPANVRARSKMRVHPNHIAAIVALPMLAAATTQAAHGVIAVIQTALARITATDTVMA